MGLDMYLHAKKYTSKYIDKELNEKSWKAVGREPYENIGTIKISVECGYWRKSNQIHNWFVENTQDGEDNCQESDVSRKQLIELKEICEMTVKILSKPYENTKEIEELLPTKSGFFFGSCEYDEYYLQDLKDTIEIINKCLKDYDESWDFSYRASW